MKKTKVAIEYVLWLDSERRRINKVLLENIEWYDFGTKVDVSKEVIDHFDLTGLSNIDFITSEYYKKKKV